MKISIRQKLLLGFSVGLVALFGIGAAATYEIDSLNKTMHLTQGKEAYLGRAQSALWDMRFGLPQFILLQGEEDKQRIAEAGPRLVRTFEDNMHAFMASPGLTEAEVQGYEQVMEAWQQYKDKRPHFFELALEGKQEEALAWRVQYTTPMAAATVKAIDRLIDVTSRSDADRRSAQDAASAQAKQLVMAGAGVAFLLALLVSFMVVQSMTKPIARMRQALEKLRSGDYSARTGLTGKDELSQLGHQFDTLLDERLQGLTEQARQSESLSNSVVEIMGAIGQMATAKDLTVHVPVTEDVTGTISDAMNMLSAETAKVLGQVQTVSRSVTSTSQQVREHSELAIQAAAQSQQEVEAAAQELLTAARTLTELSHTAQRANDSAEQAVRTTRQALATVDKTVSGINESRDLIRETEKRIKRLGERSQEISQVVGLINSIAERTGILALNASMQATSAGEAGRGFAIVADEVKRLSENAREATREIATLVNAIQSETSETVMAMNNAIAQVVDVSRLADQAGTEMKGTQAATDELVANVRAIAATSIEQAHTGQALQTRAQTIQQSSRDTTRQLSEQGAMTADLAASAQALMQAVQVFKLPEPAAAHRGA